MIVATMRATAGALLMVCLAAPLAPAAAQTKPPTKPWNYGVEHAGISRF